MNNLNAADVDSIFIEMELLKQDCIRQGFEREVMEPNAESFKKRGRVKYRDINDKVVASVTTIQNKYKDPGGLKYWAYQLGKEGKNLHRESSLATGTGTIAHRMIENHILGADLDYDIPGAEELGVDLADLEAMYEKANLSFDAYLDWERKHQIKPVETELALVDDDLRFGGTFDLLAEDEYGRLYMIDFKTSRKIYVEHTNQIAAYAHLWENGRLNKDQPGLNINHDQVRKRKQKIDFGLVLRIDKETAEFETCLLDRQGLDDNFEQFSCLVKAHHCGVATRKAIRDGKDKEAPDPLRVLDAVLEQELSKEDE